MNGKTENEMSNDRTSRRDFLRQVGLAGAGAAAVGLTPCSALASEHVVASADAMGVLVDLTNCNGCRRCEQACAQTANFDAPTQEALTDKTVFTEQRPLRPDAYTVVNRFPKHEEEATERPTFVKTNCMHCVDPGCVSACIVGALTKEPNGAVTYDAGKCMGCRYCMVACPFEIPTYEYNNVFAPVVRKCTFCMDEGNPNRGGTPACVQACPKECLTYGKRSDLLVRAHEKIKSHPGRYVDHVYGEHEAGGTSWLYLAGKPFEELGFLNLSDKSAPRLSETIQHGVFKHFVPPVAWCGILGLAMWMTRPERGQHGGAAPEGSED